MKDLKQIQEFFSKPLNEDTFKVGQKVTYLGHPAVVTATKEYNDRNYVSVSYDKGTGKTKASNILVKSGDIKPLEENVDKKYSDFLVALRDLGVTNMFGASPYLQAEFGLDKREAREILANWMRSFGESLKEGKQLDQVDFAKVVKAVEQTGHPVTVLLVPKFNEIEVITGMNAPDDMLFDLSNAVDSLGYGRNDIIIAADSSNLSRREYSDIRRVNGGAKDYFEESIAEAKGGQIMPGDYVKTQYGDIYLRVDGKVGRHDAYVRVTNGKPGKKKTGLHDSMKLTLVNKDGLEESINEELNLSNYGKVTPPKGGASLVGKYNSIQGKSKYDTVIFDYQEGSDKPYGIVQVEGHGIYGSDLLKRLGLRQTRSWTAGVDVYIHDGNNTPVYVSEDNFKALLDFWSGGLDREAKAQADFYRGRGNTSGTIDEKSLNEAKRPEPDYKQLVKLLIMAFKHEPKARFYFNRNNGVVYFDLIGGAAYSPKKSKMRDIFGGMNPIAVNREFGRAEHHEEETIKQVEQLSKGKIKAEIKELGNGVLYKLAAVKENSRFEKRLAKMAADEKEKRAKSPSYAAASKLDIDIEDFIEKGQSYGEFKKRLDKLKEYNTGLYYDPSKEKYAVKAKQASKSGLEKVRDFVKKVMKEEEITVDDATEFKINLKHLLDKHAIKGEALSDHEKEEVNYDELYNDYKYKVNEAKPKKGHGEKISKEVFAKLKGKTISYKGADYKVIDSDEAILTLKDEDGKSKTINLRQFNVSGMIEEILETIELGKQLDEKKLCKKGQAYRKRRMAAGEKSSAYLSGRAVKVCKGQMSGKKKKKKKK